MSLARIHHAFECFDSFHSVFFFLLGSCMKFICNHFFFSFMWRGCVWIHCRIFICNFTWCTFSFLGFSVFGFRPFSFAIIWFSSAICPAAIFIDEKFHLKKQQQQQGNSLVFAWNKVIFVQVHAAETLWWTKYTFELTIK